jgi:hypothetical protein
MKKLGHIIAAVVLAAGVIYLVAAQKDDAQMIAFKQSAAAFIRSEKQSTSLREVLGRGGDRICAKYDGTGNMEITLQDYKVLTVMKGRRDIIVDGRRWTLALGNKGKALAEKGEDCFSFSTAKLSKVGSDLLLSGGGEKAPAAAKPKAKKKPAPPPAKKTTKPARSYGY